MHTFIAHCQSEGRNVLRFVRVAGKVTAGQVLTLARESVKKVGFSLLAVNQVSNGTTLNDLDSYGLPYRSMYLMTDKEG